MPTGPANTGPVVLHPNPGGNMPVPNEPGIYPDLTYDEYDQIKAIRGSDLTPYLVSPRRARWKKNNPPANDALRLGRAYHTAILESHRFDKDVAVLGPCMAELKTGKRKGMNCGNVGKYLIRGKSYCGTHGDEAEADTARTLVSEYELNQIIAAKTSIMERPEIVEHLAAPHQNELTLVWRDKETTELCKARLDQKNVEEDGPIVELKTTSANMLSAWHVEKEVRKYGYDVKAGWQAAGCNALDIRTDAYLYLFVQTVQDCDVAAYWLHEDSLWAGYQKARTCLNALLTARSTNHYPGVQPQGIGVIEVKDFDGDDIQIDDTAATEATLG